MATGRGNSLQPAPPSNKQSNKQSSKQSARPAAQGSASTHPIESTRETARSPQALGALHVLAALLLGLAWPYALSRAVAPARVSHAHATYSPAQPTTTQTAPERQPQLQPRSARPDTEAVTTSVGTPHSATVAPAAETNARQTNTSQTNTSQTNTSQANTNQANTESQPTQLAPTPAPAVNPAVPNVSEHALANGLRFQPGTVAYLRCDGIPPQPGPYPCPRTQAFEQLVFARLATQLPTCELNPGQGDVLLTFMGSDLATVETRDRFPSSVQRIDRTLLLACTRDALTGITLATGATRSVVSFRFSVQ